MSKNCVPEVSELIIWAAYRNFQPEAFYTFFQIADYYLIGHAFVPYSFILMYKLPAGPPKNIKVPNAYVDFGIPLMNSLEMFQRKRAQFVLGRAV